MVVCILDCLVVCSALCGFVSFLDILVSPRAQARSSSVSSSQVDSLSDPTESEPGFSENDSEGEEQSANFKAIPDANVYQLIAHIEQEYELELSPELYQRSKFFWGGGANCKLGT